MTPPMNKANNIIGNKNQKKVNAKTNKRINITNMAKQPITSHRPPRGELLLFQNY